MVINEALDVAFMISSFLLAVRIASVKGAIFYPLRKYVLSLADKRKAKLLAAREIHVVNLTTAKSLEEREKELKSLEEIEDKMAKEDMWHKPLFTCPPCMAPWWGAIISIGHSFSYDYSFGSYFYGICLSVVLNYTFVKWLLKD